jgi:hypothetical protein
MQRLDSLASSQREVADMRPAALPRLSVDLPESIESITARVFVEFDTGNLY